MNIALAPSVVRKIILEEHVQIRSKLGLVLSALETQQYKNVMNLVSEFAYFFLKHIENEEKILIPALKDIDSWGDVRVEKMKNEHVHQRQEVADLQAAIATGQPDRFVARTRQFVLDLLKDIENEERECLSPHVMKDDPINVFSSGG